MLLVYYFISLVHTSTVLLLKVVMSYSCEVKIFHSRSHYSDILHACLICPSRQIKFQRPPWFSTPLQIFALKQSPNPVDWPCFCITSWLQLHLYNDWETVHPLMSRGILLCTLKLQISSSHLFFHICVTSLYSPCISHTELNNPPPNHDVQCIPGTVYSASYPLLTYTLL